MIPKLLHQIWLGPRPVPFEWTRAWQALHPDWEYRLWDGPAIDGLGLVNRGAFDFYAKLGQWYGAANVARVEILLAYGGLYVDVDSQPLRSLSDAPFLHNEFLAGYEPNVPDLPGRLANGTLGAIAGHPILDTYRDMIGKATVLEPSWDTTGGTLLTAAVLCHRRCCSMYLAPARVFYPRDAHGRVTPGLEEAWTDHFWASTNDAYEAVAA